MARIKRPVTKPEDKAEELSPGCRMAPHDTTELYNISSYVRKFQYAIKCAVIEYQKNLHTAALDELVVDSAEDERLCADYPAKQSRQLRFKLKQDEGYFTTNEEDIIKPKRQYLMRDEFEQLSVEIDLPVDVSTDLLAKHLQQEFGRKISANDFTVQPLQYAEQIPYRRIVFALNKLLVAEKIEQEAGSTRA